MTRLLTTQQIKDLIPDRQTDWSDEDMCLWLGVRVCHEIQSKQKAKLDLVHQVLTKIIEDYEDYEDEDNVPSFLLAVPKDSYLDYDLAEVKAALLSIESINKINDQV